MKIKYKQLPEPYTRYAIANNGDVHDLELNETVSHHLGQNSLYESVNLYPTGSTQSITNHIHRLLAMCFIKNPYNVPFDQLQVNHIDGDKLNNELNNLEWVTQQKNCAHAYQNGLRDDNNPVKIISPEGNEFVVYSQAEAARRIGCAASTVCTQLRRNGQINIKGWIGYLI